jgi:hypothetical protein
MDEMEKNNKKAERKSDSCCDLPNMKVVKGLLAVFLGVLCLMLAHKVIVSMMVFIAGLGLVYYGLVMLNMTQVTNFLDMCLAKVKIFCRCK